MSEYARIEDKVNEILRIVKLYDLNIELNKRIDGLELRVMALEQEMMG